MFHLGCLFQGFLLQSLLVLKIVSYTCSNMSDNYERVVQLKFRNKPFKCYCSVAQFEGVTQIVNIRYTFPESLREYCGVFSCRSQRYPQGKLVSKSVEKKLTFKPMKVYLRFSGTVHIFCYYYLMVCLYPGPFEDGSYDNEKEGRKGNICAPIFR